MAEYADEVIIEIQNLGFKYPLGDEQSIKNINLQIRAGEYVVITGPTGSGKTTLALCLNGIVPHLVEGELEGRVVVSGLDTSTSPVHELTSVIGMVFQNPEDQLFSLNVTDEVAFGVENMGYHREDIIQRVDNAIDKIGLAHRRNYSIFHLSGGQKQKVAIASNMAISPKIFVLDAPTADLDPISSREVVTALVDLRKKEPSKTFIVIDSDISDVITLADRFIVMNEGQVVLDGKPVDLLRNNYDTLKQLGIRMPDHIHLMHWIQEKFPEVCEFPLEEEGVRSILNMLTRSNRIKFADPKIQEHTGGADPVVVFKNVSFKYANGPVILENTDLEIHSGEWLAIIGENGTGKSTLMKLIAGLLKPNSGTIQTGGFDTVTSRLEDVLEQVGYLFQNPDNQLFMNTVEDEIAFGPRRRNCTPEETDARVNEALDLMVLQESRKNHPFTLSRGQRQRLAVATVLADRPKMLLLDEPTTGQDQVALDNLMDLTQTLIDKHGASVVMVTHDMDLVSKHATRVIVLDKGKILVDGTPLHVFKESQDILTKVSLKPPCVVKLMQDLEGCSTCVPSFEQLVENAVVQ